MKQKLCSILVFSFFLFTAMSAGKMIPKASAEANLSVSGKSAYLMDCDSKTEIFSYQSDKRLPIASMCKIMTLILCFDAIDAGTLNFQTQIPVSEYASSMGGSQVFLGSGLSYSAGELMKSIAVCSANDSCVAMAEYISGSDSEFVEKMNERAVSLGATNTLFANCTGLPKPMQYSTAHDVALMLRELVSHDDYFSICSVWNEKFHHPDGRDTDMTNTNKLIRSYSGLDGGKTGFTNEAGFCFAGTAKRGDLRAIAVVIGSDTSKNRFNDTARLFDYAFANYTNKIVLDKDIPILEQVPVIGGKKESIQVTTKKDEGVFSPKGKTDINIDVTFIPDKKVKAPIKKGDKVGEIVIYKDCVEYKRVEAVAFENDEKATFGDIVKRVSADWAL